MTATMRQVPIIEKKDRVKKKDADYFDQNTSNPGQLGQPIKIEELRHQTIPSKNPDKYVKTWKIQKNKKAKKVKKGKKIEESTLNHEQLLRFSKNMLTVDLTSKDYEPSEAPSAVTRPHTQYSEMSMS